MMAGMAPWQAHTDSWSCCIHSQNADVDAGTQLAFCSPPSFSPGPISLSNATHIPGESSLLKMPPHGMHRSPPRLV